MSDYEKIIKLWQKWDVQTESALDLRLDSFRVLFAYHSGKIENADIDYHDTREIFGNGKVSNYTGDPRALFETQNQRLCHEFLKPKLAAKEPLSIRLIKDVHGILTGGTYDERRYIAQGERPGEFKKHDYVTGQAEVGSPPESVERDLSELLNEIAEIKGIAEIKSISEISEISESSGVLKAAAYFHARFEYIHPFADGNGRVGRTLLNYFLILKNHPPIIVFDEDKRSYYAALERYDTAEEIAALCEYLKAQTEKTWAKALTREQKRV